MCLRASALHVIPLQHLLVERLLKTPRSKVLLELSHTATNDVSTTPQLTDPTVAEKEYQLSKRLHEQVALSVWLPVPISPLGCS